MRAFWTYTLLRIALFVGTAAVVYGIYALVTDDPVNLLVVIVIAAVASTALSWRLLAAPRERLAANVESRAARASQRFEEMRSREDE